MERGEGRGERREEMESKEGRKDLCFAIS